MLKCFYCWIYGNDNNQYLQLPRIQHNPWKCLTNIQICFNLHNDLPFGDERVTRVNTLLNIHHIRDNMMAVPLWWRHMGDDNDRDTFSSSCLRRQMPGSSSHSTLNPTFFPMFLFSPMTYDIEMDPNLVTVVHDLSLLTLYGSSLLNLLNFQIPNF